MVLAFSWVSSGRPARRTSWSNQGTLTSPRIASPHRPQASHLGQRTSGALRIAGQGWQHSVREALRNRQRFTRLERKK
jgi:hypothetical protein